MKQIIKKVNVHIVPCEGIQEKIAEWSINVIKNRLEQYNFSNEEKSYIYNKLLQTINE